MDTVPQELREEVERNRRYTEVLLRSVWTSPQQREKAKAQLGLNPTPHDVIYNENTLRLLHFHTARADVQKRNAPPVVIVPSLILRYYVMDLMREHSLIENLVDNGYDVYVVDWGEPGLEHGTFSFETYVGTLLRRCVRQVLRRTGAAKVSLLGQCVGGILAAMYAAVYPAQVDRLICLTAPFDFQDAGLLSLWTRKELFQLEAVCSGFGPVIPAEFVHCWFRLLDVKATVDSYKRLHSNALDEAFLHNYSALNEWLNDKIPFATPAFRNLIADLYQENALMAGTMRVDGKPVDLSNISCPVLNISAQYDHVFPESAVLGLNKALNGRLEYYCAPTGHVTCVTLFPQRLETFRRMREFLA